MLLLVAETIATVELKVLADDSPGQRASNKVVFGSKVPIAEWGGPPVWSTNGRSLAVNWPPLGKIVGDCTNQSENRQTRNHVWTGVCHFTTPSGARRRAKVRGKVDGSGLVLLDANTFERLPVSMPQTVYDVVWSPDDKMIAGLCFAPTVFSTVKNELLLSIPVSKQNLSVRELSWSPDSKLLASAQVTGVQIWNVATGTKISTMPDLVGRCGSVNWSPDGKLIAAIGSREEDDELSTELRVCDWKTNTVVFCASANKGFGGVAWSKPVSGKSFFAYIDTSLHLMLPDLSKEVLSLPLVTGGLPCFKWSPDGHFIAYCGNDPNIHIYSVEKMCEIAVLPAEKNGIFEFEWSPDSRHLAISGNSQLAVYDALEGSCLGAKKVIDVQEPRWTPDGKSIVVRSYSGSTVEIQNVDLSPGALAFSDGTAGNPWKDQVRLENIDDCIDEIVRVFSASTIKKFRECPENKLCEYTGGIGGIGFGSQLRNMWRLNYHSSVVEYFNRLGVANGANMSDIIITSCWRRLNDKPIELDSQVESARKDEWRAQRVISESRLIPEKCLQAFGLVSSATEVSPRKSKVVLLAFVEEGDLSTVRGLLKLRKLFSLEQVDIKVLTVNSDLMIYGDELPPKREEVRYKGKIVHLSEDFYAPAVKLLRQNKRTLPYTKGTFAQYTVLKELTQNQINSNGSGMPQFLIIKNGNYLTTRFNAFGIGEDYTAKIESAIKAAMR